MWVNKLCTGLPLLPAVSRVGKLSLCVQRVTLLWPDCLQYKPAGCLPRVVIESSIGHHIG